MIYVRRSPGYQVQRNITVSGEVLFEGEQTLSTKNMRISDAIKMAGGVTSDAYVRGARLERKLNDDEKARRKFLMKQLRYQSDDKDTINTDQLDLGDTYTVGIYMDKALENPGSEYDVVLREGDRIVVPEYNGTVKISGNVMYPNTVSYHPGKSYKYYIKQAGGFGNRAKKSKTWILYQNGTMAIVGHGTKIEPGCEIIVPTKIPFDYSKLSQLIQIGTNMTSLVAMIVILSKK